MMRRLVAIVVLVAGCAPLSEVERNDDVVVGERTRVGPPRDGELAFLVEERPQGIAVKAVRHQQCRRGRVRVLQRTHRIERRSNLGEVITLYVVGALASGLGIFSVIDYENSIKLHTASETEETLGIAAVWGLALTSLGLAIGSSVRALDKIDPPYRVEAPVGPIEEIPCGEQPLAGEELVLAAGAPGEKIPLGKTDDQGALVIDRELLRPLRDTGTLPETATLSTVDGRPLGPLDLAFARGSLP
jgi:hypothetical protein